MDQTFISVAYSIMKTVVSAGILINAGDKFLLVNPHGGTTNGWGIPKGKLDPGENTRNAANREVREETGLDVIRMKLPFDRTPFFHYIVSTNDKKRGKYDKHVYIYRAYGFSHMATESKLVCESLLTDGRPEIAEFGWFTLEECLEKAVKSQKGVFKYLIDLNKIDNGIDP